MTSPEPSPKRWWPRYSLRTFLIGMVVVGVGLGCLGSFWHRVRHQRVIVAKIVAADGEVTYDYQFGSASDDGIVDPYGDSGWSIHLSKDDDGRPTRTLTTATETIVQVETPPGPKLVRMMVGDDAFAHVENVSFDWDSQAPSKLEPRLLLELPELKSVDLVGEQVSDKWLGHVAQVPKLRVLILRGTRGSASAKGLAGLESAERLVSLALIDDWLRDETLAGVANLRQLESLTILSPHVTSAVWSDLDDLTELRELSILRAKLVDDQGSQSLRRLRELRQLMLVQTSISDATLTHVRALKRLEVVNLGVTNVGDAGMESLSALANLRHLDLRGTQVGDAGMEHLATLSELRALVLSGTRVSDPGVETLSRLPKLRYLAAGPSVTDAVMPTIGRMTQLETLDLYPSAVTDAGLVHLRGLTNLRRLHVGPHVTPEAANALRKALPECDVTPIDEKGSSL